MKLIKTKLGNILRIQQGFAFKSKNYVEKGKYRLVTLGNFSEAENRFKFNDKDAKYYNADFPKEVILKEGDLVLPLTEQVVGLLGNTAFIPKVEKNSYIFVLNQRVGKIVCDYKKCDIHFIHYLLATKMVKKQLEAFAHGTRQRNISPDDIYNIVVYIPAVTEQKRIGQFLYRFEQKIINNNVISKELELMAKTIYDYWFLQFEFPDKDGKPYKSNGGKMVWNDQIKEYIPKEWNIGTLNSLIKNVKGGAWGKGKITGNYIERINCIRGADFPSLSNSLTSSAPERYINKKSESKLLENGDLIVEISGGSPIQSTGRIAYINEITLNRFKNPITTSNFCKAISLKDQTYQYWFYLTWQRMYENGIFFNYEGKTTGIKNLMFNTFLSSTLLPIPNFTLVNIFFDRIKVLFERIQYNAIENAQLKSLRDFLLPMLMNGQVAIGD